MPWKKLSCGVAFGVYLPSTSLDLIKNILEKDAEANWDVGAILHGDSTVLGMKSMPEHLDSASVVVWLSSAEFKQQYKSMKRVLAAAGFPDKEPIFTGVPSIISEY